MKTRWQNLSAFSGGVVSSLLDVLTRSGPNSDDRQATLDQIISEMNRRIEAITLREAENDTIPRFNQPKSVACLHAFFQVHENIPGEFKQGLFAEPGSYPAKLRFANATNMDDSKKDIRGLSIKVFKVNGEVLWGRPGTQDFLFNSYPALFVATPEEFLSFIRARQEDKKLSFFLNPFDPHLRALWIAFKAQKKHLSPLDIRYYSTVPFRLGETGELVVKYSLTPRSSYTTSRAVNPGGNQLRAAIAAHLQRSSASFDFGVQKQTDPVTMPIEDASVIWDEDKSPFQTVATITIENQEFDDPESLAACERISFNPWQSLRAHEPLGRMNAVRQQVYQHAVKLRNKE
jgi:hypothetical protein